MTAIYLLNLAILAFVLSRDSSKTCGCSAAAEARTSRLVMAFRTTS
jgi:hypothetical protein